MTLQLTQDERNTVRHALRHTFWKSGLLRRIEEPNYDFSAGQLNEIQGALAQEALRSGGILCGDPYNREALGGGSKVRALQQRLESTRR